MRAKSLFQFIVEDVLEGGQGKESRGKNWSSLGRRGILLPYLFPWLVQPDFLYIPRSLSSDCSHHTKLCPFTAVINQDDVTQAFPRSILWDYFLNWVFLFSIIPCVKLTKQIKKKKGRKKGNKEERKEKRIGVNKQHNSFTFSFLGESCYSLRCTGHRSSRRSK